jgi:hypothetical protein
MLLDSTDGDSGGEQLLLFQEEKKELLAKPPLTTKEKLDRVVEALRNYGQS